MTDVNRRWFVLVLVSLAQFLVVLDASIVNVAMPAIQDALDFSPENLRRVLGASALRTGVEYLPLAVTILLSAGAASAVVTKVGVRPPLIGGFVLVAIGLAWFSQVSADGSWLADVLLPSLVVAVGMGMAFVSVTLAATAGIAAHEAGLASGVLNTSQQVGGALGLAILSTLANDRTRDAMAEAASPPVAMTEGFQLAFAVGAGFAVVGAILACLLVHPPRDAIDDAEAVPVVA